MHHWEYSVIFMFYRVFFVTAPAPLLHAVKDQGWCLLVSWSLPCNALNVVIIGGSCSQVVTIFIVGVVLYDSYDAKI